MLGKDKRFWAYALPMTGAFMALIAVGGASYAHVAEDEQEVRCAITTSESGPMVTVEGLYHAQSAGTGTYALDVRSAGGPNRTHIQQGGQFRADANELVRLGHATLGGSGGVYDATLTIEFNGESHNCQSRIGGRTV